MILCFQCSEGATERQGSRKLELCLLPSGPAASDRRQRPLARCTGGTLRRSAERPAGCRAGWSWCWALRHSPGRGSKDTIRRACASVRKGNPSRRGHGRCRGHTGSAERTRSVPGDSGRGAPAAQSQQRGVRCWGRIDLPQPSCCQVPSAPRGSWAPSVPGQYQLLTSHSLMARVGGGVLSCSRGGRKQLRAPEMDWHPSDEKLGSAAAPGPPGWGSWEGSWQAMPGSLGWRGSGWAGAA